MTPRSVATIARGAVLCLGLTARRVVVYALVMDNATMLTWRCALCGWLNVAHWLSCTGCAVTAAARRSTLGLWKNCG